jgi:small conductance mechanosensitive channel
MILAAIGGLTIPDPVVYVIVGIAVLAVTVLAARLVARFVGEKARQKHMRTDMVVVTRRVAMAAVVLIGMFAALGFAVQNSNVTLFGLLLGVIVAALGVQQLLQDYVSGYYVLFERHIRVGDLIEFDGSEGTIVEVRLRVTLLRNDQGDIVIVPNSELFSKPVTIRSREKEVRPAPPE